MRIGSKCLVTKTNGTMFLYRCDVCGEEKEFSGVVEQYGELLRIKHDDCDGYFCVVEEDLRKSKNG